MKPLTRKMTIAAAGVGLIGLLSTPLMASGNDDAAGAAPAQSSPMNQGAGWGGHMGMGGGGMMGPGTMGPGTMGPGMMGTAAVGDGHCASAAAVAGDLDLSTDDVRTHLEASLKWHGNARLKVGVITETDDDTITAEIVTVDDSLVRRMAIDRHTGQMRSVE